MRYVKLTNEQASKINSKKIGLTSGKRNKKTGLRPTIKFCSSLDFVSVFGYDVERNFITI
tara:strand:+ start:211 stop:390 length:180 start_codon:yes stop_codon:yes gene_type:complete